ncbi:MULTISPECIES: pentapeptide repeat-containing protein [Pseudanabaena]|uniref:pentapeptide repeat-containing protein n=1 Tax=Pseudanabaena TaxID=1152 RepID=UPI002479B99B|nr:MULTISPECIES: pentapeptide repeat-containing protein [Pseudanabaena]MEA5485543.1 pentapeptide repeat-containing protein [Pseudanabaena sp. CCNP1317]WGS70681.1 pentapeptide repeat-containing protein [Pseudanabaena galeata CCNP1313]
MASNKNIPQKSQGANEPNKQPVQSDATDVDWMIISDISTRIGGSPDIKSGSNQSPVISHSQVSRDQDADNDLEDLEWLRSLGLDDPIERPTSRNTSNKSNSQGSTTPNNEVENIDWLIVSDLKTRMDDSDNARANPSYQDISQPQTTLQQVSDSLNLEEDLGLDELNFLSDSDFSDLDSLGFDTSNSLSIDELQNEIDNTEGKIRELEELLDDNKDSSFDLSDNDWDSISGILDDNFIQPSSGFDLDTVSRSSETSAQVSDVLGNNDKEFESIALVVEQLPETYYADDLDSLDNLLANDLDLFEEVQSEEAQSEEMQSEEMQFNQIVDDFEVQDNFTGQFENEWQNSLAQDLPLDDFEFGSLGVEVDNTLDDDFAVSPYQGSFNPNVNEDEIWSSNSSELEHSHLDESVENAFTSDWGEVPKNEIDDDALWDIPSSIDGDLISSTTSIDNAFGISDNWASGSPQVDEPDLQEHGDFELVNIPSEASENADFEYPNLESSKSEDYVSFEPTVDSSIEFADSLSIEPEFDRQIEAPLEQVFEQPNNQLEDAGDLEDWGIELTSEDVDVDNDINADLSWDASLANENIIDTGLVDEADWSESLEAEIDIDNETDWSASLEAEISRGNDAWHNELVETEDYLPPSDQASEIFNDDLLGAVDNNLLEQSLNEGFDFSNNSNNIGDNDWAIADGADNGNELPESISSSEAINLEFPQPYEVFNDISGNLDTSEQTLHQQQTINSNEFVELDASSHNDIYSTGIEINEFEQSENYTSPSSEWDILSESIAEQITDSDFANYADSLAVEEFPDSGLDDNFAKYDDSSVNDFDNFDNNIVPPANVSSVESNWDANTSQSLVTDNSNANDNLGGMLDDDFDLASFDEDSLPELPVDDFSLNSIPTTLTPNRPVSDLPVEEDSLSDGSSLPQTDINLVDRVESNLVGASDPFEEALVNDLLNDNYAEVNFQEEALAHDLLNGFVSESEGFNDFVSVKEESSTITSPSLNLEASKFALTTSDHDFLDDFDLASLDPLTDDGFISAQISTGLTPPTPQIAPPPPSLPPLTKQEPTSPSVNNPPPPPFLPPLPPKRNPTQGGSTPPIPPSRPNATSQPQPPNRMGRSNQDDFDRFHSQPDQHRQRKPISSIDEGWSELLDADTVLSGGRASTGTSYSDITTPPSAGSSVGKAPQNRERRERNSSGMAKRKETGLPDFNDLGLEIHDDNTDWSGLLDSGDLSDSITTISPQNTQLPSRIRTNPTASLRSDITGISETREIPRDRRRPSASFGDSTQARMGATPDQIDFNRFTEDNYDAYGGYDQPVASPPPSASSKTKLTMPSVSLESLWQNYLKLPLIGLGAIGGVFLLYSLLNRPVFDLGLRWGLFKDASGKDFTNADFKGVKLDNVDFSKSILTGAKMQDASLVGANFQEANLDGVNFSNANLSRARLIRSSIIRAEFNKAQMNLVDLAGADLTRSNFVGARMEGANLKDSKIGNQGTETATKFSATTLLAWQIVNQPREGRNLANQDLSGLNLSFTSLKRANLTNVRLNYTDMTNTDLSGANLTGSQINGANWSGAKLNGINLTRVNFDRTKLPKTDEETICPNGAKGPCKFQ